MTTKRFNMIPDGASANGYQTLAWTVTFMLDCFCDNEDSNLNDFDDLQKDINDLYGIIGKHMSSLDSNDDDFRCELNRRIKLCKDIIFLAKADSRYEQSTVDVIKGILRT